MPITVCRLGFGFNSTGGKAKCSQCVGDTYSLGGTSPCRSIQVAAGCCYVSCPDIEGYVFRPGFLPTELGELSILSPNVPPTFQNADPEGEAPQAVYYAVFGGCKQYTKPTATFQADLVDTAARCKAHPYCVAFSTNGLLYSVRRETGGEPGPIKWSWEPVPHCLGANRPCLARQCVGTYILRETEQRRISSVVGRYGSIPDDCYCPDGPSGVQVCGAAPAFGVLRNSYAAVLASRPRVSFTRRPRTSSCGSLC